jgi:endoglucanase
MSFELLKELTETPGVSGREEAIRAIVERELKGVVHSFSTDALGNLIALRKGTSKKPKRVMYSAHMDEIGFIVRHIGDNGFLSLNPVGGHDPRNTIVQRVRVMGKKELFGVVSWTAKPLHVQTEEDKKKCPKIEDCYVDVGLSEKEVKKIVSPGDQVVIHRETVEFGTRVTGKSMDNRTAVYTLISALLKSKNNKEDTYAVFSTQEEVGCRGAQVSGYGVDPEIAVALDTTLACDTPGNSKQDYITSLGEGVGLTVMDGSVIADHALVKEFEKLAARRRIKWQPNILPRGGTDAGAIQRVRSGVRAITISLPTRYIHSSIETIDWRDLRAKIDLVAAYMKG